jgi:hypothetical protein
MQLLMSCCCSLLVGLLLSPRLRADELSNRSYNVAVVLLTRCNKLCSAAFLHEEDDIHSLDRGVTIVSTTATPLNDKYLRRTCFGLNDFLFPSWGVVVAVLSLEETTLIGEEVGDSGLSSIWSSSAVMAGVWSRSLLLF